MAHIGDMSKASLPDLRTRFVGNCPVCEDEFKLHEGKMVHHGYRRPGHGSIVGDCFAVGYKPYEVSTKGCRDYRVAMEVKKASEEDFLRRLTSGEIRTLGYEKRIALGKYEYATASADSEDPKERQVFQRQCELLTSMTEGRIRECKLEIERMDRRIAAWVLKPIKTFEEAASLVKKATAERRAERLAKQEARRAKEAAKKAKRDAWEAERLALMAKYKDLFERLANGVESLQDRRNCARNHWIDMQKAKNKKGYLRFYETKLECDAALITLGLACNRPQTTIERAHVSYADRYGSLR